MKLKDYLPETETEWWVVDMLFIACVIGGYLGWTLSQIF